MSAVVTDEPMAFVLAALEAVVPAYRRPSPSERAAVAEELAFASGADLWAWATARDPALARVAAGHEPMVRAVLERMIRERAGGPGEAVLVRRPDGHTAQAAGRDQTSLVRRTL